MVALDPTNAEPSVKLVNQTVVKAADSEIQPYILPLSGFDRIAVGLPVTIFYAYHTPSARDPSSIFASIKSSLSEALNHFYPFAGQVTNHPKTGEPFVLCNNSGVRLIEASANAPLTNVYRPLDVDSKFLLNVQLTSYACGGFSIAWTFDHALADAYGFVKFLSSWCAVANGVKPSEMIGHDRLFFRSRSPPIYNELIERLYTICDFNDIFDLPLYATEQHLYLVKGSSLESLVASSSEGGPRRTRTEALSAYLWKLMAGTIDDDDHARCKMAWTVDGRRRVGKDSEELSDFIGNVVAVAVTEEERVKDLKEGTLSHVAGMVSRAIGEAANRDHFLDCVDWLEHHRMEKVVPRVMIGGPARTIVVSSCHNLPVMSMDFGFGPPSLGTFCLPHDRLGNGYVNMVSAGRGDGSWLIYAFIWPELAAAIESDPDNVFQPFMKII